MNQELDYAEMLEIPVSTVNVVKKKSFFKRRQKTEPQPEELKERVVESVNERVGAYVYSEDVSDPPKPEKTKKKAERAISLKDKTGKVLLLETVAIGLIAVGIFMTNLFMPNSAINNLIGGFTTTTAKKPAEPSYTEFTLAPVVSELSDAEMAVSESGVLSFTAKGSVYPICAGTVSKVYQQDGLYTVEIAHTSTFTSVITGLTTVYNELGTKVASNIPVAYSDGGQEVRVTMYDNGNLLNCFTLTDEVPVWKS